ncbi:NAD(P)-dependent oxidoreductase [Sorlinia euscelidii]|uniref:NAD(P)-dependent oxidoreductase n=1 Tax=Sorlinia euscelidii TaxID=3081148 RepID=UPI003AABA86F
MLDALGPDGFLINVARGSVIDEPALISALQERRIKGQGWTSSPMSRMCRRL